MKIRLIKGDITRQKVDAVVNAANSSLLGGGGVDGAIHRAGGPSILAECKEIVARQGSCPTGEAVITGAGNMPAQYVIHTVGPVWKSGQSGEAELLSRCYKNSLELAETQSVKSIAFPNISTGIYGYPKSEAARIAINSVRNFDAKTLEEVVFVCFDDENYRLYRRFLNA